MQNNCKIIEIGTFLKNRDPPPSVFKIPKLKLGHCPKFSRFSILMPPLTTSVKLHQLNTNHLIINS